LDVESPAALILDPWTTSDFKLNAANLDSFAFKLDGFTILS
jgi:hypothetical protein